jgi:hypothetical protein
MVEAFIQDKIPPRITCPSNRTVDCTTDLSNLNVFGTATAIDNCNVRIETRVINLLNACNTGTIIREFIAIDNGGLRDSCQQIISVIDNSPFSSKDIVWPKDIMLNGCADSPKPEITGKPVFLNKDICNQPIYTFEDLTFNFVENVCYKILRKWTVIDWCTYNPNTNTGIWYHTQVIKINNTDAPAFTSSCNNQHHCITDGCSVFINLDASAIDLCTPQDELRWTFELDLNNDGSIDASGNSNRFGWNYSAGVHRISWKVKDQCGNESVCSYLIHVVDCKRPTPYCLNGIITVLMQNTGSVTIWAQDFNLASEDNCTPKSQLIYSFSADIRDIFRTYTCADIPNGKSNTLEVTMYVTDRDGNQDFCRTQIILQDNQDVCPDVITLGSVSGAIRGYNSNPSPEVAVSVMKSGSLNKQQNTNTQGSYAFGDLHMYNAYVITPSYNMDVLNGVSTKDIVKIQRHILGLELLNTPYKYIAADVNKSGSITARDITEIRRLILGIQTKFDDNVSWNFVDANYPLTVDNFASYPNSIEISELTQSLSGNDFIAIKTGDVTGEANTGFGSGPVTRNANQFIIELENTECKTGTTVKIPVRNINGDIQISGLQLALLFDKQHYDFVALQSGKIELQEENYYYIDGSLRISWNENESLNISNNEVLFYVVCKVKQNLTVGASNLKLDLKSLQSEVYSNLDDMSISMVFRSENAKSGNGYELYQNVPNPFYGETSIYFSVPIDSQIEIGLYDLSGAILRKYELNAKKGINSIIVKTDDINQSGVLYYRLEAEHFSSTKKMIILK